MQAKTEAMHRRGELAKINNQLTLLDLQDARQAMNKAGAHECFKKATTRC